MTLSEEQVEWIVTEVMRRLGVQVTVDEPSTPSGGELTISDRVVTMRSIEGRLNGISRLVLPPRAVITPAVRDELKRRNIELASRVASN